VELVPAVNILASRFVVRDTRYGRPSILSTPNLVPITFIIAQKSTSRNRRRNMPTITIYQKPTCTTCRQAVQVLKGSGQPFEAINYYEKRFTKTQLKALLTKAGLQARDVLRTKEDLYKTLGLAKKDLTEDELLALMIEHPDLIQRPIVEKGETAILARPVDTIKTLL
jgi:arsenate reductase